MHSRGYVHWKKNYAIIDYLQIKHSVDYIQIKVGESENHARGTLVGENYMNIEYLQDWRNCAGRYVLAEHLRRGWSLPQRLQE